MSEQGPEVWCEQHWRPFAEGKPGGILATVKIHQAMLSAVAATGELPPPDQPRAVNEKLAGLGPQCCYLGEPFMAQLMEWLESEHCLKRYDPRPALVCHRAKGHEGECTHFYPPPPSQVGRA